MTEVREHRAWGREHSAWGRKFGSLKQKADFRGDGDALFATQYFSYLVGQVGQVKGLLNKSTVAVG